MSRSDCTYLMPNGICADDRLGRACKDVFDCEGFKSVKLNYEMAWEQLRIYIKETESIATQCYKVSNQDKKHYYEGKLFVCSVILGAMQKWQRDGVEVLDD